MSCTHPTARALAGGRCPICPEPPAAPGKAATLRGVLYHRARQRAALAELARRRLSEFARGAWPHVEGDRELAWGDHLTVVCDHVQAQLEDWARARAIPAADWAEMVERSVHTAVLRAQNQAINLPPRSLKTTLITVCATAWAWVHWPDMRVITFSSNPRVTSGASSKFVKLLQSSWYREVADGAADQRERRATDRPATGANRWTIPKDPAESLVKNSAGGERHARGMESGFTGEGADWLLSDDPHLAHEVHSDKLRAGVIAKWDDEIFSRVNDPTRSIRTIVMQRLHVGDLCAHVLVDPDNAWVTLVLSMECEGRAPVADPELARRGAGDDVVGTWLGWRDPRAVGDSLHPVWFPRAFIATLRRKAITWAAQYQQRPDSLEGGMFPVKCWRYWVPQGYPTPARPRPTGAPPREEEPARVVPRDRLGRLLFDWVDLSVDANVKKTESGSRAGILAIGGIGSDRFVVYDSSRRRDYPELKRDLRRIVNAGGEKTDPYATALDGARWKMTTVLIEDKANGPAAIRELSTGADGGEWPVGVSIVPVETGSDSKTSRAVVMADAVQAGQWYLLDGAEWLDGGCGDDDDRGLVPEFRPFPGGDRDDRVDCASQCANYRAEDQDGLANWRGWS